VVPVLAEEGSMISGKLKLICLGMFLLLWAAIAAHQQPTMAQGVGTFCNASAIYDASTSGSTKLVTGTASTRIFVCGFDLYAGGTANVKLVYGTGGTCGTGTTSITPAFQFLAQTGLIDPTSSWRGLTPVPLANDLCLNSSAGVAVQAIVYYYVSS
jgi:hypothetical protein